MEPNQITALQEALDHLQIEQPEFKPLAGGMSGIQLYTFNFNGQDLVLRFIKPRHSLEARQSEVQALQVGHALGIAPPCIFTDQNALITILPLIRGSTLSLDDLNPTSLGTTLQRLHSYTGPFPKQATLVERIQRQYEKGKLANAAYPTGFEKEIEKISNEPISKQVPCHGDLNPSNILIENEKPLLIDWTTATLDDPFTDLGCLCLSTNMNPSQEALFLEAYLGRTPTPEDFQLLKKGKRNAALTIAVFWFRFSVHENEELSLEERIAGVDALLQSNTLPTTQDFLKQATLPNLWTAPKEEIQACAIAFYKFYLENT